ncbi:hypothetical protein BRCH_00523 [Candidatus Burkholderia brachyanthoides]|nr:hypothetical protein BRCH_00523 [Candidatus Burkholderia brachyanthoides]
MTPQLRMTQQNYSLDDSYPGVSVSHGDTGSRPFIVHCHGEVDYRENERIYGFWQVPHTLLLGDCERIEEAMALAVSAVVARGDFDLDDVPDAVDFCPKSVVICDRAGHLVLAGRSGDTGVSWSVPVNSDSEAAEVAKQVEDLLSEATYEASWDNFSTAKQLRRRAHILAGCLVHLVWREAASRALQLATSS